MKSLNSYFLTGEIVDVSSAGQIYISVPDGGEVVGIGTVLGGSITASGHITGKIGGTAITNGAVTLTSGGAAGDTDLALCSAANLVPSGGAVEIETDGGTTGTAQCGITIEISRTSK